MSAPPALRAGQARAHRAPVHLADLDPPARRRALQDAGEPAYRAEQLTRAYFTGPGADPSSWTPLPRARRGALAERFLPTLLHPVRVQRADGGATLKWLHRLHDGALVESVGMAYPGRVTVCVSSQAGCAMGCPFCATGQAGLTRSLSAGEIVEQVMTAARAVAAGALPGAGAHLTHVVFMGMGEPLANYRPVVTAIRALTAPPPFGAGLSPRGVTLSTVGLAPAIHRFAGEGLPVRLAVSLHAPDDALRDSLVPINRRFPVAAVLQAARCYARASGRRYSVEYALIGGVNDQPWRAELLARLLAGDRAHVNLIPLNPTPGSPWTASPPAVQRSFLETLRATGLPATVRDTRGREIDGACGQLAAVG